MNWKNIHYREKKPSEDLTYISKRKAQYAPTRVPVINTKNQSTILPQSWAKDASIIKTTPKITLKKTEFLVSYQWLENLKNEIRKMIDCVKNFSNTIHKQIKMMESNFTNLIKQQFENFTMHDLQQSRISSIQQKEIKYERDYTDLPINGNNTSLLSEKFYYSPKQKLKTETNETKKTDNQRILNRTLSHGSDFISNKKMQKIVKKYEKDSSIGSISLYRGKNKKINDSMQSLNNCIVSMKKLVKIESQSIID